MRIIFIALLVWATGLCPAPAASSATNDLKWGDPTGGLQMAISLDARAGFVNCWIRNAETNEITYNQCYLGYFESIGIEILESNRWVRLARAPSEMRYLKGVGPTKRDLQQLAPLQVITRIPGPDMADRRYRGWITATNAGRVVKRREQRTDLPSPTFLQSTAGVDLGDFQWPPRFLRKTSIEVRVCQELSGPGLASIYSPPFQVTGREVQQLLEMLYRDKK